MVFIYERKNLKLYQGSSVEHAIKIGDKYHTFGVEELKVLKTLVEENCNETNKSMVKVNQNHRIDEFYVNANNKVVAMDYKKDKVFDMRDKDAVNWVVRKFVEILENKDKKLNINYPENPYTGYNTQVYVPVQQCLYPNIQPRRRPLDQTATDPTLQQPYQSADLHSQPQNPLRQPMSPVNTYYIVMGDLKITLKPDSRVANYLVVTKIKKGSEINVDGKTAPSKFLTIFEKYVNDLRKEEKEIDALANFINTILPKEEKVELLVSTGDTLNTAIQYEDNEGIKTIKIKSRGIETVVYTRPVELTVFKVDPFTNKEKILEKLNGIVKEHNEKVENSKEF